MDDPIHPHFITWYAFRSDKRKPARVLEQTHIGGVYISRLTMEPGAVAGNLYHKETDVLVFVTQGSVAVKFFDVRTRTSGEQVMNAMFGIAYQRSYVAIQQTNTGDSPAVVIFFSNKPLRSDDDYPFSFPDEMRVSPQEQRASPATYYQFERDEGKPGRVLETAKVGDVYISRLTVKSGVITGNLFHKKTSVLLLVTQGTIRCKFFQVQTKEEKECILHPESGTIHVPPFVAIADKNIAKEDATVVYFSNHPFRRDDDYPFLIYEK